MRCSSMAMPGTPATSDPVAMAMDLVSTSCFSPLMKVTSTLPGPMMRPVPWKWSILFFFKQKRDAIDIALHALILEGEHGGKIELGLHLDAHGGEAVAGFGIGLAGMEQRLGGDAADIEAGAAMGGALLHHGDLHAQVARREWRRHSRRARCR